MLPDPGTIANIIDFVVEPIPGIYDAAVELTVLPAQFSLDSRYTIHTRNVGVEPIVGAQLRLHTDTAIWLGDMTYAPDSTVGQVTYWSLPTIPPGGIHRIDVEFQIQFTWLDLADVVCDSAVVTIGAIDTLLTNNTDVQCWVPGASFDPNDKQVSWSGVAQSQIHDLAEYGQSPDSLDYLIRFQNMGTAPAVDVVVQDTLDADQLDLSSFRLLASSHDVTVQTVPPNIAVFIHEEIWLPDTSVGFAESQGWVKFRIGLEAPLEPGDRLENRAAIYFDFNPPIITNPATLTWSLPVDTVVNGWQNFALGEALILPNSVTASQSVRICLNAGRSGQAALSWVATNGNVVQQINREFHGGCTAVSSPNMPGSYRLIIELDGSRWVGKVVVTH